jgi:hypothetical protein
MTEPISTTSAGGIALVKLFGGTAIAASAAVTLGFLFLWPKSLKEAVLRIVCTLICSTFFGPFCVIAVHSWWPSLFASATTVVAAAGAPPLLGLLFVAAPVLVLAGLPAWWVVGATVRWFEKRREQDLGQLVAEARAVLYPTKSTGGKP